MNGDKQAMDMENRECVDQHVAALPAPVVFEHLRIAEQITVAEHRAFAAARGAAGVQNGGQILGRSWGGLVHIAVLRRAFQQAAGAVLIQGENILHATGKSLLADRPETR